MAVWKLHKQPQWEWPCWHNSQWWQQQCFIRLQHVGWRFRRPSYDPDNNPGAIHDCPEVVRVWATATAVVAVAVAVADAVADRVSSALVFSSS